MSSIKFFQVVHQFGPSTQRREHHLAFFKHIDHAKQAATHARAQHPLEGDFVIYASRTIDPLTHNPHDYLALPSRSEVLRLPPESVSLQSLPCCDSEIARDGQILLILEGRASAIEPWVKRLATASEQKVDWHYLGSRAVILVLGDETAFAKAAAVASHMVHELTRNRHIYSPPPIRFIRAYTYEPDTIRDTSAAPAALPLEVDS